MKQNINSNAKEYLLDGNKKVGVVITHGFTSSPSYMRFVAQGLNAYGYKVFAPLLAGHGITEQHLRNASPEAWFKSVLEGINKMRMEGAEKVFIMGHSLGGVLSLYAAEQGAADGVITVAAPIKIYGYGKVKLFTLIGKNFFHTMNKPDGKEDMFRYYRADGKSTGDLLKTIEIVKTNLRKVMVPTMIIFSKDDKTVKPVSAKIIYDGISSNVKKMLEIRGDHHECIVDNTDEYIDKIHKFIEENS